MTDVEALRLELEACLNTASPDNAMMELAERPFEFAALDISQASDPVIGIAAMLISGALLRKGMPERIAPLIDRFSDALAASRRRGEGAWRMIGQFHFLFAPLIEARISLGDRDGAIRLLNACNKDMSRLKPQLAIETEALLRHSKAADYGPFCIERAWLLGRYQQVLTLGSADHRLAEVQRFHAGLVENALLAEEPADAMPLIEQELDWYLSCEIIDTSHFEFNAVCVLAVLGRFEEALTAARRLVRRGYHLSWRFSLEKAREMAWTQDMRQNEWLTKIAETPEYRNFLDDDLPAPLLGDDPAVNPLCQVKDGVWTGKKNKRCAVSRKPIAPGDPVVRFRKLFSRSSDGDLEMAARDAFAASPWQSSREEFETDTIPLGLLFPRNVTRDARLDDTPAINAFIHEVARDPRAFDIDRAVNLIASHAPPPISYTWEKPAGADRWDPAIPLIAGAAGHGDAVNLAWRLVKAGFREPMIKACQELPAARSDKVFAMLATFTDTRLRQAAAAHFGLSALPHIMDLVFKDRLALQDHATLADFGRHERFRNGLVAAMQAYGLHLYSNYRPKPDWFLAGLEHYAMAGGSALLYLLIDHPEDDPVLHTVIERRWLPDKCAGSIVEYQNARPFYVRAALFHLVRHRPEQIEVWLAPEAVAVWSDMAYDRETLRLIKKCRALRR